MKLGGAFYGCIGIPEAWRQKLVLAPLFAGFAAELALHSKLEADGKPVELSTQFSSLHEVYIHLEAAWKIVQKRLNPCPSMYRDLETFEVTSGDVLFILF